MEPGAYVLISLWLPETMRVWHGALYLGALAGWAGWMIDPRLALVTPLIGAYASMVLYSADAREYIAHEVREARGEWRDFLAWARVCLKA